MNNLLEQIKTGQPLDDILIIDCHCHMGHWHNFYTPECSAEGMLKSMNTLGINIACVTAHASIGPDYKFGNNMVMKAVLNHPDRFIGYTTISPHYVEDMKNELNRCFALTGMKAIKLHPASHRCPIDYKNYCVAYEMANERKCPVLIHVFSKEDVLMIDKLSCEYPDALFIMGHAGGEIRAMEKAIDVVNKQTNVFVDLAVSSAYEGNVEWFVHEIGSKKVIYGSDMPFYDPRHTVGRIALAEISLEEKRDVFGLNMKRILKI